MDASAFPRSEEKLLGEAIGVRMVVVEFLLDGGGEAVDLPPVIDIDEELHEGVVFAFRRVNEEKAQSAAADE